METHTSAVVSLSLIKYLNLHLQFVPSCDTNRTLKTQVVPGDEDIDIESRPLPNSPPSQRSTIHPSHGDHRHLRPPTPRLTEPNTKQYKRTTQKH